MLGLSVLLLQYLAFGVINNQFTKVFLQIIVLLEQVQFNECIGPEKLQPLLKALLLRVSLPEELLNFVTIDLSGRAYEAEIKGSFIAWQGRVSNVKHPLVLLFLVCLLHDQSSFVGPVIAVQWRTKDLDGKVCLSGGLPEHATVCDDHHSIFVCFGLRIDTANLLQDFLKGSQLVNFHLFST